MEIWHIIAKSYLEKYRKLETSIAFLQGRIKAIDRQLTSVSSPLGCEPVTGGSRSPDDKYINGISTKSEYEKRLRANIDEHAAIKAVLDSLPEDEQYILTVAYIDRSKYYIEKIMAKFYVEKTRAYELTEKALSDFALAMFGR